MANRKSFFFESVPLQISQRHWGSGSHPLSGQLLLKGVILHGVLHLAGPVHASSLRGDRQVLRGDWHERLGLDVLASPVES